MTRHIIGPPTKRFKNHPCADYDWDRSVPRCSTCVHRQPPRTILGDTRKPVVIVPPICRKGDFYTRDTAVCKHWQNQNGETL